MKQYIYITLLPIFLSTSFLYAQIQNDSKRDNTWIMGYDGSDNDSKFGKFTLQFQKDSILIEQKNYFELNFSENAVSMCDTSGKLLFFTNGYDIFNKEYQLMQNGGQILPFKGDDNGQSDTQGTLALPVPNHDSLYVILGLKDTVFYYGTNMVPFVQVPYIYKTTINMNKNGGKGKVIEKAKIIVNDRLLDGQLTATRHANGRDWWILLHRSPKYAGSNERIRLLLTPDSLYKHGEQKIGFKTPYTQFGQACFSPDGCKYAHCTSDAVSKNKYFDIFDFDRSTGLLSNPIRIKINDTLWVGGLAISPNSRFAYLCTPDHVDQYDLQASDIAASRFVVDTYDKFVDSLFVFGYTRFYSMQLAPNNKIYICTTNSTHYLHVINAPDEKGAACNLAQHSIKLPHYNGFSMPNFPNFRLGKQEGSACGKVANTDIELSASIPVFPNPASDWINIDLSDISFTTPDLSIKLYDSTGKLVLQQALVPSQRNIIAIDFLVNGIYFYYINDKLDTTQVGKVSILR
jgi:hypothetical protein